MSFLPTIALLSHVCLLLGLIGYGWYRKAGTGGRIWQWIEHHGILLAWLTALAGTIGSLIYSNVIGFPPCDLCWWQRIFLYPQVILLGVALYRKESVIIPYVLPLLYLGAMVAIYHIYIQLGGSPLVPCSAGQNVSCAFRPVFAYGYITIPTMSLTAFAYTIIFLLLGLPAKK